MLWARHSCEHITCISLFNFHNHPIKVIYDTHFADGETKERGRSRIQPWQSGSRGCALNTHNLPHNTESDSPLKNLFSDRTPTLDLSQTLVWGVNIQKHTIRWIELCCSLETGTGPLSFGPDFSCWPPSP